VMTSESSSNYCKALKVFVVVWLRNVTSCGGLLHVLVAQQQQEALVVRNGDWQYAKGSSRRLSRSTSESS
jgi:hypothetical protein